MSERIIAPKAPPPILTPTIPPVRVRTVVVEIDGRRQAYMSTAEAYQALARICAAEIRDARAVESVDTLPELPEVAS